MIGISVRIGRADATRLFTLNLMQAMYPAIIIVLVSNLMSPSDIINGTYTNEQHDNALHRVAQLHLHSIQMDTERNNAHNVRFSRRSLDSLFHSRDHNSASVEITFQRAVT